jgi:hypothetical protein
MRSEAFGPSSCQSLFTTPLEHYDVLLHLDPSIVTRYAEGVSPDADRWQGNTYRNLVDSTDGLEGGQGIRVGWDPVGAFVRDLQVSGRRQRCQVCNLATPSCHPWTDRYCSAPFARVKTGLTRSGSTPTPCWFSTINMVGRALVSCGTLAKSSQGASRHSWGTRHFLPQAR